MSFTILRLNLTVDEILALPDAGGVIRGSGGDGQIALVSHFDVARISTLILNRPREHLGETYTLTGPESLSLTEITGRLQTLLNRPLSYVDTPSIQHADILAAISTGAFREASIDVEMIGRWEPRKVEQASDIF